MEKDAFSKLKLKFIQEDLEGKISIYTQTQGLTGHQYKELLQHYPFSLLYRLEEALQ